MNLDDRIHGLNVLCGANLNDSDLRLAMREVDGDQLIEMYKQAKKAYVDATRVGGIPSALCANFHFLSHRTHHHARHLLEHAS